MPRRPACYEEAVEHSNLACGGALHWGSSMSHLGSLDERGGAIVSRGNAPIKPQLSDPIPFVNWLR